MSKKMMKRSLALGALMAFVITGSAMAAENVGANVDETKLVVTSRIDNPTEAINGKLFEKLSKDNSGGAISNSGNATISNSMFVENSATNTGNHAYGGAVYNNGDMTITNSIFYGNESKNNGGQGGAIFNNDNGKLNIDYCTFDSNKSTYYGSAIFSSGILTVKNSYFTNNSSSTSSTQRSVFVSGGTATFEGNLFEKNPGGAIGLVNAGTKAIFKGKNEFKNNVDGTAINTNKSTVTFEDGSDTVFDGNRIAIETKGGNEANVTFKSGSVAKFENNKTVKDDDFGIINHQKGTITF